MRGSRTKDEVKASVIVAKINEPDITLQELQKKTGVNYETARKIIDKDLPEVVKSSENIASLVDRNDKLQSIADALIQEMILAKDDSITVAQLTTLRESTFKQNQLIKGNVTERIEIQELDESRKAIIANRFKNG